MGRWRSKTPYDRSTCSSRKWPGNKHTIESNDVLNATYQRSAYQLYVLSDINPNPPINSSISSTSQSSSPHRCSLFTLPPSTDLRWWRIPSETSRSSIGTHLNHTISRHPLLHRLVRLLTHTPVHRLLPSNNPLSPLIPSISL